MSPQCQLRHLIAVEKWLFFVAGRSLLNLNHINVWPLYKNSKCKQKKKIKSWKIDSFVQSFLSGSHAKRCCDKAMFVHLNTSRFSWQLHVCCLLKHFNKWNRTNVIFRGFIFTFLFWFLYLQIAHTHSQYDTTTIRGIHNTLIEHTSDKKKEKLGCSVGEKLQGFCG